MHDFFMQYLFDVRYFGYDSFSTTINCSKTLKVSEHIKLSLNLKMFTITLEVNSEKFNNISQTDFFSRNAVFV